MAQARQENSTNKIKKINITNDLKNKISKIMKIKIEKKKSSKN